jgi:Tfp pilus assembly protein PilO
MKYVSGFLIFAVILLLGFLFYLQSESNTIEQKYSDEKRLFDARYGEIIRLNDEIGEYKDSCFYYRKQLMDCD